MTLSRKTCLMVHTAGNRAEPTLRTDKTKAWAAGAAIAALCLRYAFFRFYEMKKGISLLAANQFFWRK